MKSLDIQALNQLRHDAQRGAPGDAMSKQTLEGVSKQFEAMFLTQFLQTAQRASEQLDSGLLSGSQGKAYKSMMMNEMAQHLAERGVGLAAHVVSLVERLQKNVVTPEQLEQTRHE